MFGRNAKGNMKVKTTKTTKKKKKKKKKKKNTAPGSGLRPKLTGEFYGTVGQAGGELRTFCWLPLQDLKTLAMMVDAPAGDE